MATTVRITGWTAIEVAGRGGQTLCKATDPTEGARNGLSVAEAREVAAEDPGLIFLDLPVANGRVDVGAGRVWLDHPERGWIEMPSRYSTEGITEEDLALDCQLRRLSDREVRDIGDGGGVEAIRAELARLGAGGGEGIEVESHPAGVRFYDTQASAVYAPAEALAALQAVTPADIDPEDGGGFGAAWQALSRLQELA